MRWSEYLQEVEDDAREALEEAYNYDPDQSWESAYDDLFCNDSVTGNGSGSYTFSTAKAEENVAGIIFDEGVVERFREYGYDGIPTEKGAESVDVIARCIALGEVAGSLEDYWDELTEETEIPVQMALGEAVREFIEEFSKVAHEDNNRSAELECDTPWSYSAWCRYRRVFDWLDTVASECGY